MRVRITFELLAVDGLAAWGRGQSSGEVKDPGLIAKAMGKREQGQEQAKEIEWAKRSEGGGDRTMQHLCRLRL